MTIKYKIETTFEKRLCATICPNGYIRDTKEVYVNSEPCSKCKFYKGTTLFGRKVKCSYDKKAGVT